MPSLRSPQIYLLGLFLTVGFIAFSQNINSYFLSDDFAQIGKVLHGDFSVSWGQEHGGFFRPLFIWSYVIDSRIWGARPFGYHLTNLILHSLNAYLVFRFVGKLLARFESARTANSLVAITAGVLFLLHPSHTEAVTWVSGRADLLATFFVLASLTAYLSYEGTFKRKQLFTSIVCFVLALLAKESAICLPFLILIMHLSFPSWTPERAGRFAHTALMFGVVLVLFVIVRARFIGSIIGGYGSAQHLNFSPGWIRDRLLEAIVRSVLPPLPTAWLAFLFKPLQSPVFYLVVLIVLAAISASIFIRRRLYDAAERRIQNRFLLTVAGLFVVSLLPVINLRLSLYETLGERFLYLPTVFACVLIAYLLNVLIRHARLRLALLFCLLAFYSWSLYRTNLLWHEAASLSYSLSRDLVDSISQDSIVILNAPDNLRGVPVFHNGLPEALQLFQTQKRITQVHIAAFQDLQSSNDEVDIMGTEDTVILNPLNSADRFNRVTSSACLQAIDSAPAALKMRLMPCSPNSEIFFVTKGQVNQILRP